MLNNLKVGNSVRQAVIVQSVQTRKIPNGSILSSFVFADRSGAVPGVLWDVSNCKEGDIVELDGMMGYYNDGLQVQVESVKLISPDKVSAILPSLLPSSNMTQEILTGKMTELIDKIKSQVIRSFVFSLINSNDSFYQSPAGKRLHHSWIGGLAEHTISVGRIIDAVMPLYPWVDADIAMAGGLLHDIGKTKELVLSPSIKYGDEGRLLGHIYIGAQMVNDHANKHSIPDVIIQDITHIVLSHHGETEFGSPIKPSTMEAQLVSLADKMDSGVLIAKGLVDSDNNHRGWTAFDSVLERSFRKLVEVKITEPDNGKGNIVTEIHDNELPF